MLHHALCERGRPQRYEAEVLLDSQGENGSEGDCCQQRRGRHQIQLHGFKVLCHEWAFDEWIEEGQGTIP